MGLALTAADEPTRLLRRSQGWVFGPSAPYEREGDVPQVVFPCGWLIDEAADRLLMYYGSADTSISLATASLSDVMAYLRTCPAPEPR